MQSVLFWAAVTSYALATVAQLLAFAFRAPRPETAARAIAVAALCAHGAAIALRWAEVGHGPYNTRYEVFSAQAFILVAAFLPASAVARGLRPLGALVFPAAFLLMGLAVSTFGVRQEVPIIFKSWWLVLHIGFAKLFAATATLAAFAAAAYLLKRRRPQAAPQLPGLERLDLYAHQLLLVSFLFLGVMIAAGALWAHQSWGRYWGWDPVETMSLVTWICFGVILHFRVLHGWSGVRMAWLTLVAFALMVLTVYVVVLVVPTIHDSYLVS